MFFLTERVERLREAVAPDCGVILAHHTKKMNRKAVKEDPFQALSGASALRGFYTSGLLMHRPDEDSTVRRLEIELRNGPALPAKLIDKENGHWVELNPMNERLVRKEVGRQARCRARCASTTSSSACCSMRRRASGSTPTMQFAEAFENQGGLGSKHTIRDRLSVLATKGFVKFLRDATGLRLPGDALALRLSLRRGHDLRAAGGDGRSGHRRGHLTRRVAVLPEPLQMPPVRACPAGRKPRRLGLPGGVG